MVVGFDLMVVGCLEVFVIGDIVLCIMVDGKFVLGIVFVVK